MSDSQTVGSTWSVGGASARGAAHIRKGLVNQDAIAWAPSRSSETIVLAASDGHGSEKHFRSDEGSRLAVNTALSVLGEFLTRTKGADPSRVNAAAIELPARIHGAWRRTVDDHLRTAPLDHPPADPEDRFLPYGATLIAVAATPNFVLLFQIGDGDLLVGFSDGRLERPLPDDVGLVGEQTYSLCNADAARASRFRLQVLPVLGGTARPEFLMVSTDGLSKSFPDDQGFMKVADEWHRIIKRDGVDAATRELESWLANASQRGSGDDITLGLAIRSMPAARGAEARKMPEARTLERRLARLVWLSYASLALSLLSLLVAGTVWWATSTVAPPASRKAPAAHEVEPKPTPERKDPQLNQAPTPPQENSPAGGDNNPPTKTE